MVAKRSRRWKHYLAAGAMLLSAVGWQESTWAQRPDAPRETYRDSAERAPRRPLSSQSAAYSRQERASDQDLEARVRELEARLAEQPARFTSAAETAADPKADAKPDKKPAKEGTVVGDDLKMSGTWKDGSQLETADKAFKMKWRGRTQFDTVGFDQAHGPFFQGLGGNQGETTMDFRRLRIGTEGVLYDQFDFAVELDFINSFNSNSTSNPFAPNAGVKNAFDRQFFGVPAPTDVWVGMHEVPVFGNVRMGNVKPCNGLEHANSSRFLDFMERSLNQDAFTGRFNNGFQPGLLFWNYNEAQTFTYAGSFTKNTYNVFAYDSGSPGWDGVGRLTWTPYYDEPSKGRYMVHLGFSGTARTTTDGQERIRARGSLRNGISQSWSNVADTTIFYSTSETLLIPEVAAVWGPLHLQAEYFGQWNQNVRVQGPGNVVNPGPNLGTAYFQGYYAQASWFLTGEHREYDRKTASYGRVVPHTNFHLVRGKCGPIFTSGAWQLLYRYCLLDLNDPKLANVNSPAGRAGVGGGVIHDHTIGLNHFLNPNMKLQYNIVFASRTPSAASPFPANSNGAPVLPQIGGSSVGFGARLAIDF